MAAGAIDQLGSSFLNLPRQPVAPAFGILNSMNVILQYDLLRWMVEVHRGQLASGIQIGVSSPAR